MLRLQPMFETFSWAYIPRSAQLILDTDFHRISRRSPGLAPGHPWTFRSRQVFTWLRMVTLRSCSMQTSLPATTSVWLSWNFLCEDQYYCLSIWCGTCWYAFPFAKLLLLLVDEPAVLATSHEHFVDTWRHLQILVKKSAKAAAQEIDTVVSCHTDHQDAVKIDSLLFSIAHDQSLSSNQIQSDSMMRWFR